MTAAVTDWDAECEALEDLLDGLLTGTATWRSVCPDLNGCERTAAAIQIVTDDLAYAREHAAAKAGGAS